ncbi:hypothetical protein KUCAC02_024190, partial [Chaenocephalus aceratus]
CRTVGPGEAPADCTAAEFGWSRLHCAKPVAQQHPTEHTQSGPCTRQSAEGQTDLWPEHPGPEERGPLSDTTAQGYRIL